MLPVQQNPVLITIIAAKGSPSAAFFIKKKIQISGLDVVNAQFCFCHAWNKTPFWFSSCIALYQRLGRVLVQPYGICVFNG
jgi:hypothetical protein